jgi:hypothetical protein
MNFSSKNNFFLQNEHFQIQNDINSFVGSIAKIPTKNLPLQQREVKPVEKM